MIGHSPLGFSGREQNSKFRQLSQVDQSRPRCCYDVLFIKCCLFYCRCSGIQAFPKSSTFCLVKVLEINKTFLAIVRITFMFFLVRTHSWNFFQMLFSVLCDLLDESSIHDLKRGGGITSSHRSRQLWIASVCPQCVTNMQKIRNKEGAKTSLQCCIITMWDSWLD